jgi:nickel/cobalt exporter
MSKVQRPLPVTLEDDAPGIEMGRSEMVEENLRKEGRYRARRSWRWTSGLVIGLLFIGWGEPAQAHPLGQFSVNHYARVEVRATQIGVRYVVDLAELPAFREAQRADTDASGSLSAEEMETYLALVAPTYLAGLRLEIDGQRLPLTIVSSRGALVPGQTQSDAMGLATMRLTFDLTGPIDWAAGSRARHFTLVNENQIETAGWREMVVTSASGIEIYDSSVAGNGVTDELVAYPESLLYAPLREQSGAWWATQGERPAGSQPLRLRDGQPVRETRDRLLSLITVPRLTPGIILLGLAIAFGLGALHALSPGHGKALVGAYLVGTRGTARHAILLGLTVTAAHTLTVYLGGLAFLLASEYFLPERIYPILSFVSGALLMGIGLGLLLQRLRRTIPWLAGSGWSALLHQHPHLPPSAAAGGSSTSPGEASPDLSRRSLLALGISGGIIPCPSAWVLLLGAVSLQRTAYGLVLIVAFSLGLATVLTLVGIAVVHGGRFLERIPASGQAMRILPVFGAAGVTLVGGVMIGQALLAGGWGINELAAIWNAELETAGSAAGSAVAILGLGLVIGLRHALDTDHLAAVTAIVCERKNLLSSVLIGGLWGVGHTLSLLIAGIGVLMLNLRIERYEKMLEFCVALMLIGLGGNVLWRLYRQLTAPRPLPVEGSQSGSSTVPPDLRPQATNQSWSLRPLAVGMVHGLAGSAGLMLGVLATIRSSPLALGYIIIFGLGSIGGMMLMSLVIGLPARFTATSFLRANVAVRALSGAFSLGFGSWLVYEIGFIDGLFR